MVFVLSSWISVHLSMVLDVIAELLITQHKFTLCKKSKEKIQKFLKFTG